MERLFQVILSLSVSGSLVGLLLLLFRPITKRFFSKRWTYYLWLLVIVRLLLPVHAEINLMAYLSGNLSAVAESLQSRALGAGVPETGQSGVREAAGAAQDAAHSGIDSESAGMLPDRTEGATDREIPVTGQNRIGSRALSLRFAAIVWVCGAVFVMLRKLFIYRRFMKEVRSGCVEVTDQSVLKKSGEIRMRLGVGRNLPLYESGSIDSPMLIGFCRPRICLPAALLAEMAGREDAVCLILHHELVHYKRRDIWYKWLFQAALCVHWFNPLVYLFNRLFNMDCELACDETVLKALSEEGRRAYGNMLLDVAQKNWFEGAFSGNGPGIHRNVPTMTLLEEKSTLKERLQGIVRYHKTGLAVGFCSAAVLAVFLSAAVFCGAADARSGSAKTFSMRQKENLVERFVEPFLKNSEWSEMWKDSFDLDRIIQVSSNGRAYRMYDDDTLIAGDSESDCWRAWEYTGGDRSVDVQKFQLNGSDTLWIMYANKETTLEIVSGFGLYDGRFKVVLVKPDQTVQTLIESGEESTVKITLAQGRNVIKMVGQKAKLERLNIAYGGVKKGDFDAIYNDEVLEYAYQVLEGKRPFEAGRLGEICPYLEKKEVSELCRKALEQGVVLSKENWLDLFIFSDEKLTVQYLLTELQAGKAGEFDSRILVEIAPYMREADVSECFRYLLERDAVSDFDWEKIFVYSDENKSAKYLAEALQKGNVSGFDDMALRQICYRMSTRQLTDIVTAMGKEELSFDGLVYVLDYVQQDEAAACIFHYIDLGNVLTDAQIRNIEWYLSEEDFYRVIAYNAKRN